MKNKYFSILVVAIVATVASFNIYSSQKETPMSDLTLANVEALAQTTPEQPNVGDCVSDDSSRCEALHPTDPSKDESRNKAKWQ